MITSRTVRLMTVLTLSSCVVLAARASGVQTEFDKKPDPTITLTTKPTPPAAGETTFTVTAKDATGRPITGADVAVELAMPPSGGMAEMKHTIILKPATDPKVAAEGTYTGKGQIMMAGKWNATIDVTEAGKRVATHKTTVTAK